VNFGEKKNKQTRKYVFFFGILLEEVCFLKGAQSAVHLEVTALLRTGQKNYFCFFFFELFHKEIVFRYSLTITYGFFC